MKQEILCNRDNFKAVEEEVKITFLRSVLDEMGIPLENIWPENKIDFLIEEKIELRTFLSKFDILILDDHDGGAKIYVDKELVANWKKPKYEMQVDHSEIDPTKKMYLKMSIDCWNIFEEHES